MLSITKKQIKKIVEVLNKKDIFNTDHIEVIKINADKTDSSYQGYWYDVLIPFNSFPKYIYFCAKNIKKYDESFKQASNAYIISCIIDRIVQNIGDNKVTCNYIVQNISNQPCLYLCIAPEEE